MYKLNDSSLKTGSKQNESTIKLPLIDRKVQDALQNLSDNTNSASNNLNKETKTLNTGSSLSSEKQNSFLSMTLNDYVESRERSHNGNGPIFFAPCH